MSIRFTEEQHSLKPVYVTEHHPLLKLDFNNDQVVLNLTRLMDNLLFGVQILNKFTIGGFY